MNPMANNFIRQAMALIRNGGDPQAFLSTAARNDPQISQALRMIQGKKPEQLRQMAENMARESGIDLNDVARQLGITIPSDR